MEFYHDAVEGDPPGMPELLGQPAVVLAFTDADHAGNKVTCWLHTGVFIFVNNEMITIFSKQQNTMKSSTSGSKLVAMCICCNLLVGMFGVPHEGPVNVYCDNDSV